jgi:hypothetical protein
MRAKEFIVNVNVPIRIKLAGNGQPEIAMPGFNSQPQNININLPDSGRDTRPYANEPSTYHKKVDNAKTDMAKLSGKSSEVKPVEKEEPKDPQELEQNPIFVPPLQQQIEIQKAQAGKQSPVISDLLQDEEEPDEGNNYYDESDDYSEIVNRYQR